jgi:hypothetical protein
MVVLVIAGGSGGGGGTKSHGICPAKAETESTQVRTVVIVKRFIDVSPLRFGNAKLLALGE